MEWVNAILSMVLLVLVIYNGHLTNVYHRTVDKYQENNRIVLQAAFKRISELEDENDRIVAKLRLHDATIETVATSAELQNKMNRRMKDSFDARDNKQQLFNKSFSKSLRRVANLARGEEIETTKTKKSKQTA